MRTLFVGAAFLICFSQNGIATDWPQLLGPHRDGISTESNLSAPWPKDGPPVVWQKKIGAGFAGLVVTGGKLILFHRLGDRETVECLGAQDGQPIWKFDYPTAYQDDFGFDPGPRATPTVADGKVFTFGADGALHALDFSTGKKIWSVDCKTQYGAEKGFFGLACSPLVEGKSVILNIGGRDGGGIVAFDKDSGANLWKSAAGDGASYSSPIAATIHGERVVLMLTRGHFIGLDPVDGKTLFAAEFRPPIQASVTGATPTVIGDRIFISAAYDLGAALYQVLGKSSVSNHADSRIKKLWANDGQLSLQYSTAIHHESFLYGLHGRHDFAGGTELRCIELNTGKVRWGKSGLNGANVIIAGDHLLTLTEKGELIRIRATPEKFQETGRAQILGSGVRAYPALADGRFYARDKTRLVCIGLVGGQK